MRAIVLVARFESEADFDNLRQTLAEINAMDACAIDVHEIVTEFRADTMNVTVKYEFIDCTVPLIQEFRNRGGMAIRINPLAV